MIRRIGAALPALRDACRLTVVMPARNEETTVSAALDALADQRDRLGDALDPRTFDVIVFANGCSDATAARAAAAAPRLPYALHVVVGEPRRDAEGVGVARRTVMDLAANRFERAGRSGAIASTDADSVVAPGWVDATLRELKRADAVAGIVTPAAGDLATLHPNARDLLRADWAYRLLVAAFEARVDPVAADPAPRHWQTYAASLAIDARVYRAAGGLPPLACGEDAALWRALALRDARLRHSPSVRVTTSARRIGRVAGGFATYLRELGDGRGPTGFVEHPAATIAHVEARAALRRIWSGTPYLRDRQTLRAWSGLGERELAGAIARDVPFGSVLASFEERVHAARGRYPLVPISAAMSTLREAFVRDARPTRSSAASGAG